MIDPKGEVLSLSRQCTLLSITRSNLYYQSKGESPLNLTLMRLIDEQFLKTPYYGARQMARHLQRLSYCIGRKRVRRLMRFMDWHSRKVLSWRLSNTLDVDFCCEALNEAIQTYGIPEIFNTDQGSQFTSFSFTNILKEHQIKISMDGKGCWMDNVFVERLWRSLKYECVYLHNFGTGTEAKIEICAWVNHYNLTRPHSTFDGQTPHEVYIKNLETYSSPEMKQAA